MTNRTWLCLALGLACAIAGCGPGNGLTMGRVSGVVTFNGQPVEFGDILFVPNSEKGNQGVPSMGRIDKDGRYIMSTQEAGDGVIAGYQKVGIRALDPKPVTPARETPELDPATATGKDLMADRVKKRTAIAQQKRSVKSKESADTVVFNGHIHRFLVSERLANPETSGITVQVAPGSNKVDFAIQEDGTVKVSQ